MTSDSYHFFTSSNHFCMLWDFTNLSACPYGMKMGFRTVYIGELTPHPWSADYLQVRAGDERLAAALKAREIALQEAQRWRTELGKGREQIVMMEGALVRAEESARRAAADAEEKIKAVKANELAAIAAKEETIKESRHWQAQAEYYQREAAR
jgi:hypothetical protein